MLLGAGDTRIVDIRVGGGTGIYSNHCDGTVAMHCIRPSSLLGLAAGLLPQPRKQNQISLTIHRITLHYKHKREAPVRTQSVQVSCNQFWDISSSDAGTATRDAENHTTVSTFGLRSNPRLSALAPDGANRNSLRIRGMQRPLCEAARLPQVPHMLCCVCSDSKVGDNIMTNPYNGGLATHRLVRRRCNEIACAAEIR